MNNINYEWETSRNALVREIEMLGFPAELGELMARHLGSPKAIDRMAAYLRYAQPKDANTIVDEMLAIRAEIDAWREKKDSIESNVSYNDLLYYGLENDDDELEEWET